MSKTLFTSFIALIFIFVANSQTVSLGKGDDIKTIGSKDFDSRSFNFEEFEKNYNVGAFTGEGGIDKAPTTKSCDKLKSQQERMKCLSAYISSIVNNNFRSKKVIKKGEFFLKVYFKIDPQGDIVDIVATGHSALAEKEAIRAIRKIKNLIPAINNGENVTVVYSLPIYGYVV